jgi:ribonuclease HII
MTTIGLDEAGRGALAGPVVVCAAGIINSEVIPTDLFKDSKVMTPAGRRNAYGIIKQLVTAGHIKLGIRAIDNTQVDKFNVLEATILGAEGAVWEVLYDKTNLVPKFDTRFANATIYIDGNYNLLRDASVPDANSIDCVVKGDSKILAISIASIVAKVVRDGIMVEYDKYFPGYDFANSKGYGSAVHMKAIIDKRPCPIHRRTFKRVKEYANT